MLQSLRRLIPLLLAVLLVTAAGSVRAENGGVAALPAEEVTETDRELKEIERALNAPEAPASEQLRGYLSALPPLRDTAQQCINRNQSLLDSVQADLETLGISGPSEATGVQQQRQALEHRRDVVSRQLQLCRVLLLRANDLQDRVTRLRQEQLTQRLAERELSAVEIVAENLRQPEQLWNTAKLFILRDSGIDRLSWVEAIGLVGLILFCAGGSMYLRRPMTEMARSMPGGPTMTAGFLRALLACSADILPPLVTSIAVSIYLTSLEFRQEEWALITLLSYGLAAYFVFTFLIRLFLAPCPPAESYLPLPRRVLSSIAGRLRVLAILVLAVALLSATLVVEGFPDPVQRFLRLVFATVLLVELMRVIWLIGPLLRWHDTRIPRVVLILAMLFALAAEWSGYLNLAEYVAGGVVGTLLSFGLAWFVWRLLDDLYDGLDEGRRRWQRKLRQALDVPADAYMPGITWLRVVTTLIVWGGFLLMVSLMWGLSDTGLAWLLRLLHEGIQIGQFEIVPIKLLWGVIALVVLIGVTGWLKARLSQRWLTRTRMDRGARDAVVTVSGYAGVAAAIIIGLSIAGVEFTNIALIAGALSVGIGFGLQNIFNNFVSGLILLFERPVKTDDWIVVGDTEGLVKRIRIRSTEIKTFDHADVIVPNSELIQGKVTNWMLRDPFGRVIIPIRVAYGTDPEQVRAILEGIGRDHPRAITDAVLAPPPEALFRRFGDYGMEFELRLFIRDIEYTLHVQNDLNLGIEREFRKHGIVIPYPRQDVQIDREPNPWKTELDQSREEPRSPGDDGSGAPAHRGEGDV